MPPDFKSKARLHYIHRVAGDTDIYFVANPLPRPVSTTAAFRAAAPPHVRLMGPAPTPVLKIRNLYRYHLRLVAPSPRPLLDLLDAVPPTVPLPSGVELAVDVDPVSLL